MSLETITESIPPVSDLFQQVADFSGPAQQFWPSLLVALCRLGPAEAAAVLQPSGQGQGANCAVRALVPAADNGQPPAWLVPVGQAVTRETIKQTGTLALRRTDDATGSVTMAAVVLVPLRDAAGCVAAFLLADCPPDDLPSRRQRLEVVGGLAAMHEMRQALVRRGEDLAHLQQATQAAAVVAAHSRFRAAAMAFCNHLASAFAAERVCLGFLHGRVIKLAALSHSEKFTRKTRLVQDIEGAMEECLDQDVEVLYPAEASATYIWREAAELAQQHGAGQVLALPLRRDGKAVAVVTLERPADRPFLSAEIDALRLICELVTPHLATLQQHDRWIGAKAATALHDGLAVVAGPKHTWVKAAAAGVALALVLLFLIPATDKVEAPFVLRATARRQVPAPFEGFLESVAVEPNDRIIAGQTILAQMHCEEDLSQRVEAVAQRERYSKEAAVAMRDGKTADYQIALAQAQEADGKVQQLDYRIKKAAIVAPVSGTVLSGDLKHQLDTRVQTGQVLFEVAPDDSLWAEVAVPEDRVRDVTKGQKGFLASAGYPGNYVPFHVQRISPIAEVVDQQNIFKVRVELDKHQPALHPGMMGIAKINMDRKSCYARIWTRSLVNWLRMKLWV
jgi:biotin carboxyl carrier protein